MSPSYQFIIELANDGFSNFYFLSAIIPFIGFLFYFKFEFRITLLWSIGIVHFLYFVLLVMGFELAWISHIGVLGYIFRIGQTFLFTPFLLFTITFIISVIFAYRHKKQKTNNPTDKYKIPNWVIVIIILYLLADLAFNYLSNY